MGRKKVRLELITNESTRKTTFRKRKAGLLKKANELTTLCGVEGCAIVYGPNEPDPHVWPSREEAEQVLTRFKSLPAKKQAKHMMNHEECLDKNLMILEGKVEEGVRQNRDLELEMLLDELLEEDGNDERLIEMMSLEDMKDLCGFLDKRLEEIPKDDGNDGSSHVASSENLGDGDEDEDIEEEEVSVSDD
ncbi:agamous-like MADS-box protein AGL80 [Punica granatum]|uniref:MADS-box domain-containing protein n=2 Tax=Punica granatum TaxID=22663 RepID=A0A218XL87_PUNGR|nr:agamous-like MADS-box protein AGL80 [Punica granatum]OWM85082.1 hypothetical protein CDL15_Pgr027869 [Punica granatum]PKI57495.1 hypothetical protein CRG98_022146 [Punica granatum]